MVYFTTLLDNACKVQVRSDPCLMTYCLFYVFLSTYSCTYIDLLLILLVD